MYPKKEDMIKINIYCFLIRIIRFKVYFRYYNTENDYKNQMIKEILLDQLYPN